MSLQQQSENSIAAAEIAKPKSLKEMRMARLLAYKNGKKPNQARKALDELEVTKPMQRAVSEKRVQIVAVVVDVYKGEREITRKNGDKEKQTSTSLLLRVTSPTSCQPSTVVFCDKTTDEPLYQADKVSDTLTIYAPLDADTEQEITLQETKKFRGDTPYIVDRAYRSEFEIKANDCLAVKVNNENLNDLEMNSVVTVEVGGNAYLGRPNPKSNVVSIISGLDVRNLNVVMEPTGDQWMKFMEVYSNFCTLVPPRFSDVVERDGWNLSSWRKNSTTALYLPVAATLDGKDADGHALKTEHGYMFSVRDSIGSGGVAKCVMDTSDEDRAALYYKNPKEGKEGPKYACARAKYVYKWWLSDDDNNNNNNNNDCDETQEEQALELADGDKEEKSRAIPELWVDAPIWETQAFGIANYRAWNAFGEELVKKADYVLPLRINMPKSNGVRVNHDETSARQEFFCATKKPMVAQGEFMRRKGLPVSHEFVRAMVAGGRLYMGKSKKKYRNDGRCTTVTLNEMDLAAARDFMAKELSKEFSFYVLCADAMNKNTTQFVEQFRADKELQAELIKSGQPLLEALLDPDMTTDELNMSCSAFEMKTQHDETHPLHNNSTVRSFATINTMQSREKGGAFIYVFGVNHKRIDEFDVKELAKTLGLRTEDEEIEAIEKAVQKRIAASEGAVAEDSASSGDKRSRGADEDDESEKSQKRRKVGEEASRSDDNGSSDGVEATEENFVEMQL